MAVMDGLDLFLMENWLQCTQVEALREAQIVQVDYSFRILETKWQAAVVVFFIVS